MTREGAHSRFGQRTVPWVRDWLCAFAVIIAGGAGTSFSAEAPATTSPAHLTSAREVLDLRHDTAATGLPVRLRGVVLLQSSNVTYVKDFTASIRVRGVSLVLQPGEIVEIAGRTAVGYMPEVAAEQWSQVGLAPLPVPQIMPSRWIPSSANESQWVTVSGAISEATRDEAGWRLCVNGLETRLFDDPIVPVPVLENQPARVTGVLVREPEDAGPGGEFRLLVPSTNQIQAALPANDSALAPHAPRLTARYDRPASRGFSSSNDVPLNAETALELMQSPFPGDRIRFTGTVVHRLSPERYFLANGKLSVRVMLTRALPLERGERIEVGGFPMAGPYHLWLVQSDCRRLGPGQLPEPLILDPTHLDPLQHDARIISVRGQVIGHETRSVYGVTNQIVLAHNQDTVFEAYMPQSEGGVVSLPVGSLVQFTGVCSVERDPEAGDRSLRVLLHSAADAQVLALPPPRLPRSVLWLGLVGASLGTTAWAWVLLLRREVRRRTVELESSNARLQSEVSARERAEDELRGALAAEKELGALKSNFVSMVSHEFRTPLEVILSSSNILDRYLDRLDPEKRTAQLRAIRKSVHRMDDLVEDVLLLGKFDAGRKTCQPTPLQLIPCCRSMADEVEAAADREGAVHLQSEEFGSEAAADESLLRPLFINLLNNALKYSPRGSGVEFCVRRCGHDAEFIVRDRGCGIPVTDQPRLFTAFYRGSNVGQSPGSGLGLAIVKRCVDLHGGTVVCHSEEGRGTTFVVTLPLFDGTRRFRRTEEPVPDRVTTESR